MEILSVRAVRASRFSRAPLECSRHRSPVAAGWLRAEITAGPKRDFSYDRIRLRALWLRSQLAERIPKMSSASMKPPVKELCSNRRSRSAPYPRTQPGIRTRATQAQCHTSSASRALRRCLRRRRAPPRPPSIALPAARYMGRYMGRYDLVGSPDECFSAASLAKAWSVVVPQIRGCRSYGAGCRPTVPGAA